MKQLKTLISVIRDDMENLKDLLSMVEGGPEHRGSKSAAAKARKLSTGLAKNFKDFRQMSVEVFK